MGGKGKGGLPRASCEDRTKRLAKRFCDGDEACVEEVNGICDVENDCLKWAKLRQWTGNKKCKDDEDCIERNEKRYAKSEEWCLKTCDEIVEEICGERPEEKKGKCEELVKRRAQ